ncbi:MAG TPA: rRNA maturation RNase YbeY [Ignavibacteria bacterium]
MQTQKKKKANVNIDVNYNRKLIFKRNILKKIIVIIIEEIVLKEKKNFGCINFLFCSDEEILEYNKKYLSHNYYTDIITFYYPEKDYIDADVLISMDSIINNAKKYDVDYESELFRVIIHGLLHLCGYEDKTMKQKLLMRKKENQYLKQFLKTQVSKDIYRLTYNF